MLKLGHLTASMNVKLERQLDQFHHPLPAQLLLPTFDSTVRSLDSILHISTRIQTTHLYKENRATLNTDAGLTPAQTQSIYRILPNSPPPQIVPHGELFGGGNYSVKKFHNHVSNSVLKLIVI